MIDQVAEVFRDTLRLVYREEADEQLKLMGGRLLEGGERQTPEGTADHVLDDNDLRWKSP